MEYGYSKRVEEVTIEARFYGEGRERTEKLEFQESACLLTVVEND